LQPWPPINGLYYPRGFVLEEVYNARLSKVSGILGEALTVLLWGGIALGVTWYVRWGMTGRAGLGEFDERRRERDGEVRSEG
jgi:hypothetical protein